MYKIIALCVLATTQITLCQVIPTQHPGYGNALAPNVATNPLTANPMAETALANNLAYPAGVTHPTAVLEPALPVTGVPGLNQGLNIRDLAASRGNGLRVTSSSPLSPTGLKVESDNMVLEGPVNVNGKLPFLGVVAIEGPLPAAGHGDVAYGCGNGHVGILTEGPEVINGYPNPGMAGPGMQARPLY